MAEIKTLNTRIKLRIDTLENWNKSTVTLLPGEIAFASVAAGAGTGLTEPVIMAKIATEEGKTFAELPWAFHAKASDVLTACKSEAALKTFVNGVIADAGIASSDAMEALAGRVTTAEGKITTLEGKMATAEGKISANETAIATLNGLVGDTKVADQITTAINNLKLGETYAAKSLETTVADHVADTVAHVTTADKTKWNGALQASDIASGSANGTIAVKGTDVAITGLGSAAYTESTAYDAHGSAATAEANAKAYAKEYADGLASNYDAAGAAATAESNAKAYAKEYADGLAGNYDASGSAAQALTDAKAYTDSEMDRLVGDKTVGTQITEAITGLDLANTYDAKGAAAAAETAAKSHADGLNTAMDERVQALEAIDHDHDNKDVLDGITAEKVAAWDAAEQNAKDHADGLNTTMDGRVAALEALFEDGEGSVADQIADAVAAEAALREEEDGKLQDAIDAIEADYLKAADKTALQEQITSNDGEIAALQGLVGDKKVSEAIADAVKVEKERAEGIEGGLETRLAAVEADYIKAADKTELEGKITANANAIELLTNGVSAEEVDGVNDLIQYVKDHGTEVTGMKADIKANADAIDAIEADYLKAADKNELSGLITGLDTRMGAAETAIGTKAAQADLEALAGRVSTVEGDLNTETTGLKARMTAAEADIDALEELVGDDKVSDQIAAVTNPLAERVVALEAVDHEHANKALLDTYTQTEADLADAVAKKHEHANKAELDKFVDGDKAKLDAAVQTVTAGTGLTATKTGTDVAINIDESVTWVFDCGDSTSV